MSFTTTGGRSQQELSLGSPPLELSKPCKYMHLSVYASRVAAWFIHGWFALMLVCVDDWFALMLVCIDDWFVLMIGLH